MEVTTQDLVTKPSRSSAPAIGRLSNRKGTSFDDGTRKSNSWLDQWQSSKLGTGSRVWSFPLAFTSSTDDPVLLLNQPNMVDMSERLASTLAVHTISAPRKAIRYIVAKQSLSR